MIEDKYVTNAESTSVYSGMEIQEDVLKLRIENEQLKVQIEKMKCCGNCSKYNRYDRVCSRTKFSVIETLCNCSDDWELRS